MLNNTIKRVKKRACEKFENLFEPPLLIFTELGAITATTLSPPKKPLNTVDNPKALMSLLTLDRLFIGSNLSTAFILKSDSILAIKVRAITLIQKAEELIRLKSGTGKSVIIF